MALRGFCDDDRGRTPLFLAAGYGDIPWMAFARRPGAESAGLNHRLPSRPRSWQPKKGTADMLLVGRGRADCAPSSICDAKFCRFDNRAQSPNTSGTQLDR